MKLFSTPDHGQRSVAMSPTTPIVFVVDDDISVRESLEALIRFAGWQPETFASAQEFLSYPPAQVPNCLVDRKSTRLNSSHLPTSRMPSSA